MRTKAAVLDRVRAKIRSKGYRPCEVAKSLPSTRSEFMRRFMQGREDLNISLRRAISMAEAVGLEMEEPRFRDRPSLAPQVLNGTPRQDWG
jgi:LytS/YehU family sensor histidine kinase